MYCIKLNSYELTGENIELLKAELIGLLTDDYIRMGDWEKDGRKLSAEEALTTARERAGQAIIIEDYKTPAEMLAVLKRQLKEGKFFSEWEQNFLKSINSRKKNFSSKQESVIMKMYLTRFPRK